MPKCRPTVLGTTEEIIALASEGLFVRGSSSSAELARFRYMPETSGSRVAVLGKEVTNCPKDVGELDASTSAINAKEIVAEAGVK